MKYFLIASLSALFFTLTYASAPKEFRSTDLMILSFLLVSLLIAQCIVARFFIRYRIAHNLILASFATINILYLNLVLNDAFINLPEYAQLLALLTALFILMTFMNMLDEVPRVANLLPAFLALIAFGVAVQASFSTSSIVHYQAISGKTSSDNVRIVEFETKPNVYFISFDSLIPKALLKKHFNSDSTQYHLFLDENFRRFKNFFANREYTKGSLNSLLALDLDHFLESEEAENQKDYFTGLRPSPMLEIFKQNGYTTNTHYNTQYFGNRKGPYVDNYNHQLSAWTLRYGVCEFIDTWGFRLFTFMGYCAIVKSDLYLLLLDKIGSGPEDGQSSQIEFLIDRMRAGVQSNNPQVFVAYIFSPGHTPVFFNYTDNQAAEEYIKSYLIGSEKTASQLEEIVSFIQKEDPEGIVFLFGDHGPYLSRKSTFEDNPVFVVQDRLGVYGGIYPADSCAEQFEETSKNEFITVIQGALTIIKCLSGGESALIKEKSYFLPNLGTNDKISYKDYLYE